MRWSIGMAKSALQPPFQRPSCLPLLSVAPSLSASSPRAFTSRDSSCPTVPGRCHLAVCQRQLSRLCRKFREADLVCGASRDSRTADNEYRDDIVRLAVTLTEELPRVCASQAIFERKRSSAAHDFILVFLRPFAVRFRPGLAVSAVVHDNVSHSLVERTLRW